MLCINYKVLVAFLPGETISNSNRHNKKSGHFRAKKIPLNFCLACVDFCTQKKSILPPLILRNWSSNLQRNLKEI